MEQPKIKLTIIFWIVSFSSFMLEQLNYDVY